MKRLLNRISISQAFIVPIETIKQIRSCSFKWMMQNIFQQSSITYKLAGCNWRTYQCISNCIDANKRTALWDDDRSTDVTDLVFSSHQIIFNRFVFEFSGTAIICGSIICGLHYTHTHTHTYIGVRLNLIGITPLCYVINRL